MRQVLSPTNTTQQAAENPMLMLAEALGGGVNGAIERMEARGQQELAKSDVLPTKGLNDPAFAAMGIVIGEQAPGDRLFTVVTLPAGWSKKPTDHSMWNELRDDKNRVRASFFYKAAFYDRDAFIHPKQRYSVSLDMPDDRSTVSARVVDGDTVLFQADTLPYGKGDYSNSEIVMQQAETWLTSAFPEWKSASAYWS